MSVLVDRCKLDPKETTSLSLPWAHETLRWADGPLPLRQCFECSRLHHSARLHHSEAGYGWLCHAIFDSLGIARVLWCASLSSRRQHGWRAIGSGRSKLDGRHHRSTAVLRHFVLVLRGPKPLSMDASLPIKAHALGWRSDVWSPLENCTSSGLAPPSWRILFFCW